MTARIETFLARCRPDPRAADASFVDAFRKPQSCLDQLARDAGWARLKKGDPRKDQALGVLSSSDLERLVRRVPDLIRVARAIAEQAAS